MHDSQSHISAPRSTGTRGSEEMTRTRRDDDDLRKEESSTFPQAFRSSSPPGTHPPKLFSKHSAQTDGTLISRIIPTFDGSTTRAAKLVPLATALMRLVRYGFGREVEGGSALVDAWSWVYLRRTGRTTEGMVERKDWMGREGSESAMIRTATSERLSIRQEKPMELRESWERREE